MRLKVLTKVSDELESLTVINQFAIKMTTNCSLSFSWLKEKPSSPYSIHLTHIHTPKTISIERSQNQLRALALFKPNKIITDVDCCGNGYWGVFIYIGVYGELRKLFTLWEFKALICLHTIIITEAAATAIVTVTLRVALTRKTRYARQSSGRNLSSRKHNLDRTKLTRVRKQKPKRNHTQKVFGFEPSR